MSALNIKDCIIIALPDATVEVRDLTGNGDHYAANIISAAFRGKTRVQQHKMIYSALKGNIGTELHALTLQTATPED